MITSRSNQVGITSSALACVGMNEREKKRRERKRKLGRRKRTRNSRRSGHDQVLGLPSRLSAPLSLDKRHEHVRTKNGRDESFGPGRIESKLSQTKHQKRNLGSLSCRERSLSETMVQGGVHGSRSVQGFRFDTSKTWAMRASALLGTAWEACP